MCWDNVILNLIEGKQFKPFPVLAGLLDCDVPKTTKQTNRPLFFQKGPQMNKNAPR